MNEENLNLIQTHGIDKKDCTLNFLRSKHLDCSFMYFDEASDLIIHNVSEYIEQQKAVSQMYENLVFELSAIIIYVTHHINLPEILYLRELGQKIENSNKKLFIIHYFDQLNDVDAFDNKIKECILDPFGAEKTKLKPTVGIFKHFNHQTEDYIYEQSKSIKHYVLSAQPITADIYNPIALENIRDNIKLQIPKTLTYKDIVETLVVTNELVCKDNLNVLIRDGKLIIEKNDSNLKNINPHKINFSLLPDDEPPVLITNESDLDDAVLPYKPKFYKFDSNNITYIQSSTFKLGKMIVIIEKNGISNMDMKVQGKIYKNGSDNFYYLVITGKKNKLKYEDTLENRLCFGKILLYVKLINSINNEINEENYKPSISESYFSFKIEYYIHQNSNN